MKLLLHGHTTCCDFVIGCPCAGYCSNKFPANFLPTTVVAIGSFVALLESSLPEVQLKYSFCSWQTRDE
jgi:hypothetical protein